MSDFFNKALDLPESLRYQLAMLLLHSLEPKMVQENSLSEDQLRLLYEAKEKIETGKASLVSREELRASIQALREKRKEAS